MANTIKQKRGTTDPGASDLVVGELAINTTDGGVFTKTDGGTVVEVGSGGGGASEINDLSDAVTRRSGNYLGVGSGALAVDSGTTVGVALGKDALNDQTSGAWNCALGVQSLSKLTTAQASAAAGNYSGRYATGGNNAFFGYSAGRGTSGSASGNYNVAVGASALQSFTSGDGHIAIGYQSLKSITTGDDNVSIGYQSGDAVTTGSSNTFLGHSAGGTFTTGSNCTAIGHDAQPSSNTVSNEITLGDASVTSLRIPGLQSGASDGQVLTFNSSNGNITLADAGGGGGGASEINDLSDAKTANSGALIGIGTGALENNTSATSTSLAIGLDALNDQTTGTHNVAIGNGALAQVTTGHTNTAVGRNAGTNMTDGTVCTFVGMNAGKGDSSGGSTSYSVAVGEGAFQFYSSANDTTAIGYRALRNVTTGSDNTALGYESGLDITTGVDNVLLGHHAGRDITTANGNIAIGNALNNSAGVTGNYNVAISGDSSGRKLTSGNNNVFIGTATGQSVTSGASNVYIGDNAASGSSVTTGISNTFIGRNAGQNNTASYGVCLGSRTGTSVTGNNNTIIGNEAQYNVSLSGTNNLILGANADASTTSVSNEITLGDANITSLRIPGLQSGASDGQVLTYSSSNGNIALADAGGGGSWNLISTTTVSSSVTSVDFTSIGSYNRYVLLWDCACDGAKIPKIQIYDNGTLETGSNYSMIRTALETSGYSGFATTSTGWITTNGLPSQIGRFDISVAHSRATIDMMVTGFRDTGDNCRYHLTGGGMKSTYTITDITGFRFTTTSGTAVIDSGRFSLYGIGQ